MVAFSADRSAACDMLIDRKRESIVCDQTNDDCWGVDAQLWQLARLVRGVLSRAEPVHFGTRLARRARDGG